MEKFTKIIGTIGPATNSPEMIQKLANEGMNIARINFSHGDPATRLKSIKNIRLCDDNLAIMGDSKGPEIRTGDMQGKGITLSEGSRLAITKDVVMGTSEMITVHYPHLSKIAKGCRILFDDGLIETMVIDKKKGSLVVEVLNDGILKDKKSVTIIGHKVKLPFLTDQDKEDILFAVENHIHVLAASFVRCKEDIRELKSFLIRNCAEMMIIAKIEHPDAVENIDAIIEESDGIMVARGDLGVELPLEDVPGIQSQIIKKCNTAGKPVIVATQMLESMRENPRPTRAEVSDIAQAILQGADAIMLSAETATGKYPVRAVQMMKRIAQKYETRARRPLREKEPDSEIGRNEIARFIATAAYYASENLDARAILTPTESGFTARNVSRFKPKCPIFASTRSNAVLQWLHLSRGVVPMLEAEEVTSDDMAFNLVLQCYEKGLLDMDDRVIIISGVKMVKKGGTNLLEIYVVSDILANIKKRQKKGASSFCPTS
jgi:pyruvate kinase